jgi:hypothetical protein
LAERTADLRGRLARGDYDVHGALEDPADRPGVVAPDEDGVLALAIQVLLGPAIGSPVTGAMRTGEET